MEKRKVYNPEGFRWVWMQLLHIPGTYDRYYFGPCPTCGSPTYLYGGGWRCVGDVCPHNLNIYSSNPPAPAWWNTDINVKKDGDSWFAYYESTFTNTQKSTTGRGDTPAKAVNDLEKRVAGR